MYLICTIDKKFVAISARQADENVSLKENINHQLYLLPIKLTQKKIKKPNQKLKLVINFY